MDNSCSSHNLSMPQPEPTGEPAPGYNPVIPTDSQSDEPPPYGFADPHPEFKAAFENQDQLQPQQYPVPSNQPAAIAYPPHSANYYPTNVSTYPPTASTVVVSATGFPATPITAQCMHCFQVVNTRVEYVNGSYTWMMCCLICILCPLFCWLIPFCMIGMKDVYHYCPKCNHLMGTYSRA